MQCPYLWLTPLVKQSYEPLSNIMKIENWIKDISEPKRRERLLGLRQRYEFLTRQLFHEYQPTMNSNDVNIREFMQRLELWLDRFENEEEQIVAFQSIGIFLLCRNKGIQ